MNPTIAKILQAVAHERHMSPAEICQQTKRRNVVSARHEVWRRGRQARLSYPECASIGRFHWTTVQHATRKWRAPSC